LRATSSRSTAHVDRVRFRARPARPRRASGLDYNSEPAELGPRAPRVGEWIPDLAWVDLAGKESTLSASPANTAS
jgi:hypothetical protein